MQVIFWAIIEGGSSSCLFRHLVQSLCTFVRGDDFVSSGKISSLEWLKTLLQTKCKITITMLASGDCYETNTSILTRVFEWHDDRGARLSGDPRHAKVMTGQLGCANAKPFAIPIENDAKSVSDHGKDVDPMKRTQNIAINSKFEAEPDDCLDAKRLTSYRAGAARANYLTTDRADICFAVNGAYRSMSKPTHRDMRRLEGITR